MKLNPDISQNVNHLKNIDTPSGTKNEQPAPDLEKAAKPGTEVSLSDKSVEFSRATEMMHRIPEERAEKIEAIKAKLRTDHTK